MEAEQEKVKKQSKSIRVNVQVIENPPGDKTLPLVGYFPSGFNPHKNLSEPVSTQLRLFKHKGRHETRLELVATPSGSNVNFVGSSFSGEGAAPKFCEYRLGILDKETKTLKIVPISNNKIFRLEPRVGGTDSTDKEIANLAKEEASPVKKAEQQTKLDILYGTKKSVSQAKKKHALNKEEDPSSRNDMERIIKGIDINKEALESASALTARNIPPYDSSATKPEEAYPLDKIIHKGEWDYLDYNKFFDEAEPLSDAYPTFVRNRVKKLGLIQDEERETIACILSYITHLIKFKDQHSMDGVSSAKNHKMPGILRSKFVKMFGGTESKNLQAEKINLLISYVLVLTLHVDGFETYPSDIAKDLKMTTVALRSHLENIGCKLTVDKSTRMDKATLKVPLQFPTIRKRKRVNR